MLQFKQLTSEYALFELWARLYLQPAGYLHLRDRGEGHARPIIRNTANQSERENVNVNIVFPPRQPSWISV